MAQPPEYDWFLAEWLAATRVKQADLVRALGWSKAKSSDVVTGKQRYTRDLVNEVAGYLNIRPYELLMSPEQAHAMRGLRETAARIVNAEPRERVELDRLDQPRRQVAVGRNGVAAEARAISDPPIDEPAPDDQVDGDPNEPDWEGAGLRKPVRDAGDMLARQAKREAAERAATPKRRRS